MVSRIYWLLVLFFIASTTAIVSSSSSYHSTSTTKKSVTPTSSTHHRTTCTTKKTTQSTSSTHHTSTSTTTSTTKKSSTSTKSTTKAPTSTPSTFYLVAEDTGSAALDGSYFGAILDTEPLITPSGDRVIHPVNKNPVGASNFTLLADGTLQCNSASGPLWACVSNGHPVTQPFMFEAPADLGRWGFVATTCAIAKGVLSCQWGPLTVFYYAPPVVVNGTKTRDGVDLGLPGDSTPFTMQVVPT